MKKLIFLFLVFAVFASSALAEVDPTIYGSSDGKTTLIRGVVYNTDTYEGVNGVNVNIYCDETFVKTVTTYHRLADDTDGYYETTTDYDVCNPGHKVWASAGSAESDKATIVRHSGSDWGLVPPLGVPEFSTITMGAAVIAGGLGFILLRKK